MTALLSGPAFLSSKDFLTIGILSVTPTLLLRNGEFILACPLATVSHLQILVQLILLLDNRTTVSLQTERCESYTSGRHQLIIFPGYHEVHELGCPSIPRGIQGSSPRIQNWLLCCT